MKDLVIMRDKNVVTTSLKVAEVFGKRHDNVLREIEGLLKNEEAKKYFYESTYEHPQNKQNYKLYYINRDGFTLLAMGFTGKEALQFKLDFLNQYNRMEEYITNQNRILSSSVGLKESFEMALTGVEYTARILRTDTTSNIKMLEEVHNEFGVTTVALPAYVDEDSTSSLTELLKHHEVEVSAIRMNRKLIESGILEEKERLSRSNKSGIKKFKSLTDKGLKYGKNLINPKNPKETQPHYYESKFGELLELVKVRGGEW